MWGIQLLEKGVAQLVATNGNTHNQHYKPDIYGFDQWLRPLEPADKSHLSKVDQF
jgi:hypothetical protein